MLANKNPSRSTKVYTEATELYRKVRSLISASSCWPHTLAVVQQIVAQLWVGGAINKPIYLFFKSYSFTSHIRLLALDMGMARQAARQSDRPRDMVAAAMVASGGLAVAQCGGQKVTAAERTRQERTEDMKCACIYPSLVNA